MIEKEIKIFFDSELLALNESNNKYEQIENVVTVFSFNHDGYSLTSYFLENDKGEELVLPCRKAAQEVDDYVNKELEAYTLRNYSELAAEYSDNVADLSDYYYDLYKDV